jgi:hypothetical protein
MTDDDKAAAGRLRELLTNPRGDEVAVEQALAGVVVFACGC